MFRFLSNLIGVIVKPVHTFRSMLEAPRLIEALAVVLLAAFSSGIATSLMFLRPRGLLSSYDLAIQVELLFLFSPGLIVVMSVISGVFSWIFFGAIFHALSRVLGGKGGFEQTLLVAGFSQAPLIYSIFLGVLGWAIASDQPIILSSFILTIWLLILLILGLREAHKFSALRAFAAIFITVILITVVIVAIVIALITILIPSLQL